LLGVAFLSATIYAENGVASEPKSGIYGTLHNLYNATQILHDSVRKAIRPDLPLVSEPENFFQDPAIKEFMKENKVFSIITNDSIQEIIAEMGQKIPFDEYDGGTPDEIFAFSEEFLKRVIKKHPGSELYIENRMNRLKAPLGDLLSGIISIADENIKSQIALEMIKSGSFSAFHYKNKAMIFAPGTDGEQAMDMFFKRTQILDFQATYPRGELIYYALFTNAHESEHVGDKCQINIRLATSTIIDTIEQYGFELPELFKNKLDRQLREIDADIGAMNALQDTVSDEFKEYIAAFRIAMQNPARIDKYFHDVKDKRYNSGKASEGNLEGPLYIADNHETGFHLAQYLQTREIPDYYTTQLNVNTFYEASFEYYFAKLEAQLNSPEKKEQFKEESHLIRSPSTEEFLGIVIQAQKDGFYSPEQSDIAHILIKNLEIMGAKPAYNEELQSTFSNAHFAPSTYNL